MKGSGFFSIAALAALWSASFLFIGAFFYGTLFLGETLTLRALLGLALILTCLAGATGARRLQKCFRRPGPPVP